MQKKIPHIGFVSSNHTIIKIIFLVLISVVIQNNLKAQWEPITPYWRMGVIRSLIEVKGTLYSATETSGVFATTNWGTCWILKNKGLPSTGVLSIIHHNGVLYAAVYEKGLFQSTDGGTTWLHQQSFLDSETIVALRSAGTTLYVATVHKGVFSTTDNGKTWSKRTNTLPNVSINTIDVKDKMIVVGTSYGVEVSTNEGNTWTLRLETGSEDIVDVKIVDEYTIMVLTTAGLQVTRNGGVEWHTNGPDAKYGILRTIYSDKENTIYFGINNGITYTTDKGNSWVVKMNNRSLPTVALIATDSLIITGDVDGNMFISWNKGNDWLDVGEESYYYDAFANNNAIFTFNRNIQLVSYNHGNSWMVQKSYEGKFRDKDLIVCSGDTIVMGMDDTVRISTDNGSRWKSFRVEARPVKPIMIQKNKIIVKVSEGIKSVDIENGNIKEFDFGIDKYVSGSFLSYKSTVFMNEFRNSHISFNGGKTWKAIPFAPENVKYLCFSVITDKGITYLATTIGLLSTKDSGLTWEKIKIGTDTIFVKLFVNKNTLYAKNITNNIYFSSDTGKVWNTLDKTGVPQYPRSFFSDDEYLYLADRIVYRYRIADIIINNTPEEQETFTINNDEISLSPNPTTDEITIKGISNTSPITYTLTDIIGNVISNGTFPEQTKEITLSTKILPSGFYNIIFQMNGTKHIEKLIVVH